MASQHWLLMKSHFWYSVLLCTMAHAGVSQTVPLGTWTDYLPYQHTQSVSIGADKVYCAAEYGIFSYDKKDGYLLRNSKANGLSDIGVNTLNYYEARDLLMLGYTNGNIDLYEQGSFENIPDLQQAVITGGKKINHIYFKGSFAYLSTSFGIVVVDLDKKQIKDTYKIGLNGSDVETYAVSTDDNNIYASTKNGLYKASLVNGDNLLSFTSWHLQSTTEGLPVGKSVFTLLFDSKILTAVADTIFQLSGNQWTPFYTHSGWSPQWMSANGKQLLVAEWQGNYPPNTADIALVDPQGSASYILDQGEIKVPKEVVQDNQGNIWVADFYLGLIKYDGTNHKAYFPNGPSSNTITKMDFEDGALWVASGSINTAWNFTYNRNGFFGFQDAWWTSYNESTRPELSGVFDVVAVKADPFSDAVYFGSHANGLIKLENNQIERWDYSNSPLQSPAGDTLRTHIGGFAFDSQHNLWMTNNGTAYPLVVKKTDGTWKNFPLPEGMMDVNDILIDDYGQLWIIEPRNGDFGIAVYDPGENIDDVSDDKTVVLKKGAGVGNLPDNNVNSVAKDRDGEIWIGTDQGLVVFYCAYDVMNHACDGAHIIVEQDGFPAYLFDGETINDIEVDGANRKWIATNNGVWLMSADGITEISYFNQDNSPLLSNEVLDITIDPISGLIFFGTSKGIISYRGTATEGTATMNDVLVYPNPVRADYSGPIAIKGLSQDAYVKITDVSGNLIYATQALGGQAIWNGKTLDGQRAATGVYLVFSSDASGAETFVSKFLMIH